MSNYYYPAAPPPQQHPPPDGSQGLQFFPSSYSPAVGRATPSSQQTPYGYAGGAGFGGGGVGGGVGVGGAGGVSGRMGDQAGGLRKGWLAAFSTEGYPGEPPLLEELGINFDHIQRKTLAVLNPFGRIDQHIMDDADLGGPIIFFLLFGTFLLFAGKVHFGYVYGLALFGSVSLHAILSLMTPDSVTSSTTTANPTSSPPTPQYGATPSSHYDHPENLSSTLTFPRTASVLGYCLLPEVATSLVGIVVPMDTPFGIVLTSAAILWCTASASGMICAVGRMRSMRALVAYPVMLFYIGFGIMAVFSSRGSGSLAKATANLRGG